MKFERCLGDVIRTGKCVGLDFGIPGAQAEVFHFIDSSGRDSFGWSIEKMVGHGNAIGKNGHVDLSFRPRTRDGLQLWPVLLHRLIRGFNRG